MAHARKKKRTHAGANIPTVSKPTVGHASIRTDPKSMVIRIGAGSVGPSVSQLASDVRRVMEPGTASRLRERRANRLKDYTVMTGPLGVTHLLLFSRSESGNTNLRVALAPRGPTLNFRVEEYSLCRDVQRAQRHPRGVGKEYMSPPLLVMNNFVSPTSTADTKVPRHLETLTTTVFQSLFPPINPQKTPLKSIKRVLLLNREPSPDDDGTFIINFRHYAITTRAAGVSRAVKRIQAAERVAAPTSRKATLPNLGRLEDIADYMIGGETGDGYATDATSGSEPDTDNEVEVLEALKRKPLKDMDEDIDDGTETTERRAVKLVELGPRMRLRMTKVEDGMCAGRVMWHEYVTKTQAEAKALDKRWEQRRQEKEARRREQKANIERKKKEREEARQKSKGGGGEMDVDDDDEEYISPSEDEGGEGEDEMEGEE